MSVFCKNFALAGVWAFGRFADIKMDTKSIKTPFTIIEKCGKSEQKPIRIVLCLVIARCYRLLRSLWHRAIKGTSGKPLGTSRLTMARFRSGPSRKASQIILKLPRAVIG